MSNQYRPLPADVRDVVLDPARGAVLSVISVLDFETDADFDRLVLIASTLLKAPLAAISFIGPETQRVKSRIGFGDVPREFPVEAGFCAYAIAQPDLEALVVTDASQDERFAHLPLVAGPAHIRFYMGAPILVRGQKIGTLAVFDPQARPAPAEDVLAQMRALAETVASFVELKEDAKAQTRTSAALIQEEWRHALTLEAGRVGSWVWDVRSGEVVINDIFRRMFGLDPNVSVTMDDIFGHIEEADLTRFQAGLAESFENGSDYEGEFRLRDSGRWLMTRGRVYQRDSNGQPLVMMGINFDITETKRVADQTRLLLRELNHRVKNTLAMVQSLARQTQKTYSEPAAFLDSFSGRLRVLMDAHAILSNRDWSGIRMMELIEAEVRPSAEGRRLELSGEDVHLPTDHALGLALILHELVSNAERFGALSVPEGVLHVSWMRDGEGIVTVFWREEGGPPVIRPKALGFGGQLIERSLSKVIGSSVALDFPQTGVTAAIRFPL